MTDPAHGDGTPESFADTWVVMPTYDEAENLEAISAAILEKLPGCTLLVVDDNSPDGTGEIADRLAVETGRVQVLHRPGKQGLGRAYIAGFRRALEGGARRIVQMDADWSHDPAYLPAMVSALAAPADGSDGPGADVVIGSRYVRGGGVQNWGVGRRLISRGGSVFAGTVLRLPVHDLTAGFKAWRASTLAAIPFDALHAGGYGFQVEMAFLADRLGARMIEHPIVFPDRRVGVSKMSRRIFVEALFVVLTLRWEELRGRSAVSRRTSRPA